MYEVRIIHNDEVGSCATFSNIKEIFFKIDGEVILKKDKDFYRINSTKIKAIKIIRK